MSPAKKPDPLTRAGWTVGDVVMVNSRNRNSHGSRGTVDGFDELVPGQVRVKVLFERGGARTVMTFCPTELVPTK